MAPFLFPVTPPEQEQQASNQPAIRSIWKSGVITAPALVNKADRSLALVSLCSVNFLAAVAVSVVIVSAATPVGLPLLLVWMVPKDKLVRREAAMSELEKESLPLTVRKVT